MTSPSTRSNNLDALRLLGAAAVILGHAYPLTGRTVPIPGLLGFPVHALGVVVFFSISGYLITASWSRSPDVASYAAARALRILPALAVTVVLTVFVLGPLLTSLTAAQYFADPRSLRYLVNIVMQPQYDLPGVFVDLPYPGAVNGSLWTLPAEVFCYVAVPVLCLVPRMARPLTFGAALVVSLVLAAVPAVESPVIYGSVLSDAAHMWTFFAAGALLRLAHERVPNLFRTDVAVVLTLVHSLLIAMYPTWIPGISWATLPYVVLTVGLASTPYVRRAARFGDLSYGMYLVGFPVQQLVVAYVGVLALSVNLVLVVGISALLSWVSWRLVEAPSLRLKGVVVRRRPGAAPAARPVDDDPTVHPPVGPPLVSGQRARAADPDPA